MVANNSKSDLPYSKKLDQYNNTYHYCINKKAYADYSTLTEKIETNPKATEFKAIDIVRIINYKDIFSKV